MKKLLKTDPIVSTRICKFTIACPLLKTLLTNESIDSGSLQSLIQAIIRCCQMLGLTNSPALLLTKSYLKKIEGRLSMEPHTSGKLEDLVNVKNTDDIQLEKQLRSCMKTALVTESTQDIVHSACKAMLDSQDREGVPGRLSTLLLDWLELLDPDLVAAAPELQQKLLFARKSCQNSDTESKGEQGTSKEKRKGSNQAYLLALLTHQSSWTALHSCINTLLSKSSDTRYCATTVLDFLWACLQIPKIWQGRQLNASKNQPSEDILSLSLPQIECVLNYIMEEAILASEDKQNSSSLSGRVELLLTCSRSEEKAMKFIVNHAQSSSTNSKHKALYQQLLIELYAQCPKLMIWLPDLSVNVTNSSLGQDTAIQVDLISFRLLTSLGKAGHGRKNEERMHDANIACRKLASQHPVLMLRQMPLISALLKGKTHFTIGKLRHSNYLLLFTHVLGLLEAMQPQIFRRDYTKDLDNIIESYMSLMQNHITERTIAPIVVKFVRFLHNYMNCEQRDSAVTLKKYVEILSNVSGIYPDLPTLKSLLAGLTLPHQETGDSGPHEETGFGVARSSSPWTVSQIAPYLRRIQNAASFTDVMDVLRDLDETSKRKVDILEHFLGDLKKLLLDLNDVVRNTSYSLIMRYARHSPRTAVQFLGSFLQCLDSDNADIITSALKNLPEFCVLCQDHADVLLQKAFMVGTTTSLETNSFITETIQTLNLETTVT